MGQSVNRQSWPCTSFKCGKVFGRKGDLTRHQQLHSGVRPHECEICLKRFSQASGLKTHKNVHSKEKPFACDFGNCRATFGDPSSCARHRKETHRRIIPYRCPMPGCRSSIKRRSAFASHLKKHGLDVFNIDLEAMAPPLLPAPLPLPRRRGTRSIINYDIKPMKLAEEQKLLERRKLEQSMEEYYAQHVNYSEPWFNNTYQRPMDPPLPILSCDIPPIPASAWEWDSSLDYYTGIAESKLDFTASYSQPHPPPANNTNSSTPSTSTPCSSPQLSPVPKLESPTLATVGLAGTQMVNAQAAFSYLHMPTPDVSISKGISFHQPDQKPFGNPFHSVQHQYKDSFSDLLQLGVPWAFS
ncbi:hypothetical protein M413DRAFT_313701 [Hebeloma cylindrosporum]|uniref:C2H2-type domain-containing protein n=1 Tax=Hebeloma cylindrosporum TaxID=76867 RepID=A0A0C2YZK5_HEBCY|nr:hypothetical protein M413DRAFT_313701 [Hebeloma cylindrosporum h7]